MGYEIQLKYHEEISKGEYNREEVKVKNIKVGTPYEEIPLEVAAGKIIAQLARRNILVVDVEIYEYTKKKLSYKEAEDGIVIKNKKFKFDDGAVLQVSEEPTENDQVAGLLELLKTNPNILATIKQNGRNLALPSPPSKTNKPLRYELFDPVDRIFLDEVKRRGLAFTLGKKYPIYGERKPPNEQAGLLYVTEDDNGNRQVLSDKHFITIPGRLENGFGEDLVSRIGGNDDARLDWGNSKDFDNIPDIRR